MDLINKNHLVAAGKTFFSAAPIYFNFDLLEQFIFAASVAKIEFCAIYAILGVFFAGAFYFSRGFYYIGAFIGSLIADVAGAKVAEFSKN